MGAALHEIMSASSIGFLIVVIAMQACLIINAYLWLRIHDIVARWKSANE